MTIVKLSIDTHYHENRLLKVIIMIGTSPPEYIFIRACILFLHNITPISILYSVQLIISQFLYLPTFLCHIPFPVQVWLIAEAVFFATVFMPLKSALHNSVIYYRS